MKASAWFGIPGTVRTLAVVGWLLGVVAASGQIAGLEDLARLTPARTRAANALWAETPLTAQFKTSQRVVVADLKGPGVITMVHFAMPQALKLNRDVRLRTFWDGETAPSVDVPLVDFFCDPA